MRIFRIVRQFYIDYPSPLVTGIEFKFIHFCFFGGDGEDGGDDINKDIISSPLSKAKS